MEAQPELAEAQPARARRGDAPAPRIACAQCKTLQSKSAFSKRALRTHRRCLWCVETCDGDGRRATRRPRDPPVPAAPPPIGAARRAARPPPAPRLPDPPADDRASPPADDRASPPADDCAVARAEEREALEAIFGDGWRLEVSRIRAPLDVADGGDDDALFGAGDAIFLDLDLSDPGYPLRRAPAFALEYETRDRVPGDVKRRLERAVGAALAASVGEASAFSAWGAANDALRAAAADHDEAVEAARDGDAPLAEAALEAAAPAGAEALARRLIFSHHIIAPSKRAGLRQLAVSLGVTALVKIGWPGVIVLEGDADRVEAYVGAIQGWRWKKLAVRGEQELDDGEERALPRVFLELDDMSALAQIMRDAGLEDLFRRVFK